jgi:hypothetical protein
VKFFPLELPHEWEWVRQRTHVIACEDSQGIVVYDNNGIAAIAVLDSFTVDGCCVHLAIDNPLAIRHGLFSEVAGWCRAIMKRHSSWTAILDLRKWRAYQMLSPRE